MDNDEQLTHWCETCERPVKADHEHPFSTLSVARARAVSEFRASSFLAASDRTVSERSSYSDRQRQLQMLSAELWARVYATAAEQAIDCAQAAADEAVRRFYQRFHDPHDGPAGQQDPHFIRVIGKFEKDGSPKSGDQDDDDQHVLGR